MGDTITRKCACCKNEIVIDVDDVRDVSYFDKLYYHTSCLHELATQKSANKRCSPKWTEVLTVGWRQAQIDARNIIDYCYGHDKLFDHILYHYNVYAISSYTKMMMENVVKGKYKGKSKPIPYRDFAGCWIESQANLDDVYRYNQKHGKSMTDEQRINYDLAIVVRTYPDWKKKQEYNKRKLENRNIIEQHAANIDYTQIKINESNDGLGDISNLLDEI
jgi:hypothetical protein